MTDNPTRLKPLHLQVLSTCVDVVIVSGKIYEDIHKHTVTEALYPDEDRYTELLSLLPLGINLFVVENTITNDFVQFYHAITRSDCEYDPRYLLRVAYYWLLSETPTCSDNRSK